MKPAGSAVHFNIRVGGTQKFEHGPVLPSCGLCLALSRPRENSLPDVLNSGAQLALLNFSSTKNKTSSLTIFLQIHHILNINLLNVIFDNYLQEKL